MKLLRQAFARRAALALLCLPAACAMQPRDVPQLSDGVLCDIVAHRDTSFNVRQAARDEIDLRGADCDRLAAVLRRQHIDGLRRHVEPDDPDGQRPNYTDCVLNPICQETQ